MDFLVFLVSLTVVLLLGAFFLIDSWYERW
jgi:hypothetical protein